MSDFWGTIGQGLPVPWPDPQTKGEPSLHPWLDGNRREREQQARNAEHDWELRASDGRIGD